MSQSQVNEFLALLQANRQLMAQLSEAFGTALEMADHHMPSASRHMARINAELLLALHRIENPSQV